VSPTSSETLTITTGPALGSQTRYKIYEDFATGSYLSHLPYQPPEDYYIRGTLKKWTDKHGTEYYFIRDMDPNRTEYYEFCKNLFMKVSGTSLEQKVEELSGAS
jgi:hypothetical protein